ncbi:hypothetical protein PCAR4_60267 [Paraburkholderia caribensis]|nr:hypothetical protein PCAR4_60267 [Paraburkholderia caribensis]
MPQHSKSFMSQRCHSYLTLKYNVVLSAQRGNAPI